MKTFDNFIVPLPAGIDPARYDTVIVWCETFPDSSLPRPAIGNESPPPRRVSQAYRQQTPCKGARRAPLLIGRDAADLLHTTSYSTGAIRC